MDNLAKVCGEWLEKKVMQFEATDPMLQYLKLKVNEATAAVQLAVDQDSQDERSVAALIRSQNEAIEKLIVHTTQHSSR
jgi:hypothetical protein